MENITKKIEEIYQPFKALVFFQSQTDSDQMYVEAYDMDKKGNPINAHPLSVQETISLATDLSKVQEVRSDYMDCGGLIPEKVLALNQLNGSVIWYTPTQQVNLLFSPGLNIPNGKTFVPAMVWKADREELKVFALVSDKKPQAETPLYNAPFFNIYPDARVCMGTVATDKTPANDLNEFMLEWEHLFWNSYFSHLNDRYKVKGNIVQLWQNQIANGTAFPKEVLIKYGKNLKDIAA